MDAAKMDKILGQIYRDAEAWRDSVESTDLEKSLYLSAVVSVVEKYDPANVVTLFNALNRMLYHKEEA